jgi:hypothetical protein
MRVSDIVDLLGQKRPVVVWQMLVFGAEMAKYLPDNDDDGGNV